MVFQKLETKDGDTTILVYINSLTASQTCFNIDAIQTNIVVDLKDATIEVIDYYDTSETKF